MYTRFVEPGRLALITYGPCAGKICTIIDIVDQQRVVVDGPEKVTGVSRHMLPVKRLSLTDLKAKLSRGAREKALKTALEKDDVMKKWAETAWAKAPSAWGKQQESASLKAALAGTSITSSDEVGAAMKPAASGGQAGGEDVKHSAPQYRGQTPVKFAAATPLASGSYGSR